ncbi:hypothetical protein FRC07_000739, partial [Ceratobasidium sp. 392]
MAETSTTDENLVGNPVDTISRNMPASEIVTILIKHKCPDATSQLKLDRCGRDPVSGGGSGDIFRGELIGGEQVAIKCLRLYLQQNEPDSLNKVLKDAARELYAWSRLEHKNVLKLFGLAQFQNRLAMVSPWMDKGTLLQYIKHNPATNRYELCVDISEGVAYLHENGVSVNLFKAPEVLSGCPGTPSKEADVYALGMEVVTGTVPFSNYKNDATVCNAVTVKREIPNRPNEFPSFSSDEANQLWKILFEIGNKVQGIRQQATERSLDISVASPSLNTAVHVNGHRGHYDTYLDRYRNGGFKKLAYFIVFPNIYVFDKHRIFCLVDDENQYHELESLKPNPPRPENMFYIDSMPYWFDCYNQLWYNLYGQWYPETTYPDLVSAKVELNRCAEQNRLAAPSTVGPSSDMANPAGTPVCNPPEDPNLDDEYLYPPLNLHPGQLEVDVWFEEFKSRRAALQRTGGRLGDIKCPLEQCRKVQKQPQALRDHLYIHFGVKRKLYFYVLADLCTKRYATNSIQVRLRLLKYVWDYSRKESALALLCLSSVVFVPPQANILVSSEGVAKLTDFGCTKLKASTLNFTTTTSTLGLSIRLSILLVAKMNVITALKAPEVVSDNSRGTRSEAADVYALGMLTPPAKRQTLWEAITGKLPFEDKDDMALCVAMARMGGLIPQRPNEFPSFSPDEANQLWEVVVDSCSQIPSDRPVSVAIRDRVKGIRQQTPEHFIHTLIANPRLSPAIHASGLEGYSDGYIEVDAIIQSQGPENLNRFVVEAQLANLLLQDQVFFISFSSIYVFDKHRIVCRVDSADRYHQLDYLKPNPPRVDVIFQIDGIQFRFDPHNQLWYSLDGQWFTETTHSSLLRARKELARDAASIKSGSATHFIPKPFEAALDSVHGSRLSYQHASMLLLNQLFFIVFPHIYVFDENRIVCRVDSENLYHIVDLQPNPPNPQSMFYIDNMPYRFDRHNQLRYNLDGQWYPETTYSELVNARVELNRCAEQNRLAAPSIAGPSSTATNPPSTVTSSPPQDSNYDDEYLYPPLILHPEQAEVDAWFEEFKSRRAALQRTDERLGDIKCPLEQCRKVQRRPRALRDHLYLHFGIK